MTTPGEPIKKPPVGLVPRNIAEEHWRAHRRDQIKQALIRYMEDDQTKIPIAWVTEYNELVEDDDDEPA